MKSTLLVATVAALTTTGPAYAYIDPGTGTLVVQSLIGGIAATMTMAGVYYSKLKAGCNGLLGRKSDAVESEAEK